jgi:predicted MFS family arabinose efflux permease
LSYGASLLRYFSFLKSAPHLVLLTLFLLQLMPTALTAYAPSWFIREGCSVPLLALVYCVASVGSVVSAMQSGAWAKKLGVKPLLIALNLSMALLAFLMVRVPFSLLTVTCLFALFSACLSARMAQMQAVSLQQVGLSERGRFSALISCFTQLGATIGIGGSAQMLSQLKLTLVPQGIVYIATGASVILVATAVVCLLMGSGGKVWGVQGRTV